MFNDCDSAVRDERGGFCGEWIMLRHAESVNNEMCVWTGQSDAVLSEWGVSSLRLLRESAVMPRADVIVSSPLVRCTDSVRLLFGRDPDVVLDEFKECDLGEWVGQPYSDLTNDERYLGWVRPPYRRPSGGESLPEFRERVMRGIARLNALLAQGTTALIMTHGNVMRAVMSIAADDGRGHSDWDIPNSGGYRLIWRDGRAVSWSVFQIA